MRVKRGNVSRKRHKKVLKALKGGYSAIGRLYKVSHEVFQRGGNFNYRDRRDLRSNLRRLWTQRINAAVRLQDLSYSRFIGLLHKANVKLDRKILSDLAAREPEVFSQVVEFVKKAK